MSFGKFTRQEIIDLISGSWSPYWSAGGGTPGGPNYSIQFNSASIFSGSNYFTYDPTSGLYYTGSFFVSGAISASSGPNTVGFYGTASWAVNVVNGGTGAGTPGGPYTSIQFNSGGFFSGSSNFTFNSSSNAVYLTGSLFVSGAISASYGPNTVGFYGTSSWAVSASWAPSQQPSFNGTDQYLARFSGSNGIEIGSIYNDRIAKSINSGELNTMSIVFPISHSHVFGYNNIIDVNLFSYRYSTSSVLAGQYNLVLGADAAATINKLTSAVGNYDFIQNLFASSAPRVTFSGWVASSKTLYAPISGDIENLFTAGRTSLIIVINKLTNAAFIGSGIVYPNTSPNKVSIRDNNFETWNGNYYDGRGIYVSSIKTVNPGFESTNYTNAEIVVFVLDGSNGYYDTQANHAQNIGTSAHGVGTHAEGYYTQTRGYYTHAQNFESVAAGTGSSSSGYKTVASSKYTNANNVFTAAGASYYFNQTSIFRSSKTYHNYFYDYGTGVVGTGGTGNYDNIITYLDSDQAGSFGDLLYTAGYVDHTNPLKCIIQVPELNYIGIVELFCGNIGGSKRPVTFSDILPDNVGRPTMDDINGYRITITALEPGTFMDSLTGGGFATFTQGIETLAAGSASFAGGQNVVNYGNRSFAYGKNIGVIHDDVYIFGTNNTFNTINTVVSKSFQVSFTTTPSLLVTGSYVGINTSTLAGFTGLNVGGDIKASGNSYLGNDVSDVVVVTGSLYVSNSIVLNGNEYISGSLQVTGSQYNLGSFTNIGTLTNTGSVKINGDLSVTGFQVIGGNVFLGNQPTDFIRVTGSVQMTGSLNVIGPVTANNVFLTGSYNGNLTGQVTGSLTGSFIGTGSGDFNGNFIGIYTGSINPGISFYGTSSWAASASVAISTSLSSLSSNVIGGATNYIPVWTSATSLSSSAATDNGSVFAINRNTEITGTFANNVPSATNQTQPSIKTNADGVLIIGSFSSIPTAVPGGIYFDGSDFYLGFA